jgi:hypothetical protein
MVQSLGIKNTTCGVFILEKQLYVVFCGILGFRNKLCVEELFTGCPGDLKAGAERFQVLLGLSGRFDEEVDAERFGLDFLVFLQCSANGDKSEPEDLAGREIDFLRNAHIEAVDSYGEALFRGLGIEGDPGEDEQIGFRDLVVCIVGRYGVGAAYGSDEGFGEVACEGHGAWEDAGLDGFSDFRRDFIVVRAVEAEGFVDGKDSDGGGSCEEGEEEQDENGLHGVSVDCVESRVQIADWL